MELILSYPNTGPVGPGRITGLNPSATHKYKSSMYDM